MAWDGKERRDPRSLLVELSSLKIQLATLSTQLQDAELKREAMHLENKKIFERINTFIFGNGTIGAMVRLDRLEQREQDRSWSSRIIAGSVIGLVIKALFDLLIHR